MSFANRTVRRSFLVAAFIPVLVGGVALYARLAHAGTKNDQQIYITGPDTTAGKVMTAQGSIGSARNSPDGLQNIGCDLGVDYTDPNNPVRTGGCQARNAAGTWASCVIPTTWGLQTWTDFANAMANMGPTPYIYFKATLAVNGQYICSAVHVYSHSDHAVPVN